MEKTIGGIDMPIVLNEKQARAVRLLAEAMNELNKVWTDELGEALHEQNLLPNRCLLEATQLLSGIAADGVIEE